MTSIIIASNILLWVLVVVHILLDDKASAVLARAVRDLRNMVREK